MIRRPPRSTQSRSSAASDVYKRQLLDAAGWKWNAAKTARALPDGTPATLKIPYSTGATFREREVTLMEPMLAKLGIKIEHNPADFDGILDAATAGTFIVNLHGVSLSLIHISEPTRLGMISYAV